jgi:hypothetical protein
LNTNQTGFQTDTDTDEMTTTMQMISSIVDEMISSAITQSEDYERICPKCGQEMYANCEPEDEGGCWFENATDEDLNEALKTVFKTNFKEAAERLNEWAAANEDSNWLPYVLNFEKQPTTNTRFWYKMTKVDLLKIVEGIYYEDEMPELIQISAQ